MKDSNNRTIIPLTKEQADLLNQYQKEGKFHPYTCGFNRTDEHHLDGEGVLVAVEGEGWKCPYCDYTQNAQNSIVT